MTTATKDEADRSAAPRHVRTLIIGSGFAGLGAAIKLDEAGQGDFLVLERGADVGGTWRDNTYPGAACDVPSQLYSYSFALNPDWSRSFSRQGEIQDYIRTIAERSGVLGRHRFGVEVLGADWDGDAAHWRVQTTDGDYTADAVIAAVGALCEPALPDIKGISGFQGELFHSSQWNHDADLTGKRVAIIGTGASAIQIVPSIAADVAHLDVYQRTAPWVMPRADRRYSPAERFAFRHVPGFQRLARAGVYAMRETQVVGLARVPALLKPLQLAARLHLRRGIKSRALRTKVTPDFTIGCKRMLISNDYYPALDRDDVDVVTDRIREVTAHSIITEDGSERAVDALIVATGFHVTDSPTFEVIRGRSGDSLAETWRRIGMQAYKGTTVAGFPNMFFMVGPNTGLGHSSMVYMIESQINYVVDAVSTMHRRGLATVEVRGDVQDGYNRDLQHQLGPSVWMTGGCASWYLDSHGNNTTLWPGFTFDFRRRTRRFDLDAYHLTTRRTGHDRAGATLEENAS
ncbi:flavin-containing monooxygenase [Tomitella fengzijianii]|uniref:NAD(P)/FAD-dependent oxidoreductase n=1 Tax=Tomitella fengzijianii TaxID=2597660 RepID=A0A516X2E5_9ACTN|nr:NAD(P)/FAD-dependent oxidoreductase [Tomitella fengzijianii]QDQ97252.1 NAD(P)/FAD-dependent oxidoreductase [Tomitella fengzijianii]